MGIAQKLLEDMKTALKGGESERLSVIRMARAALQTAQIAKRHELTEEETLEVLAREVKRRREAAEEYRRLAQEARGASEEREAAIIAAYLPQPLTDAEIGAAARQAIQDQGAVGPRDLGKVMAAVMPTVKGRADGRKVNEIVRRLLGE